MENFEVIRKDDDIISILYIKGYLDAHTAPQLEDSLQQLIDEGYLHSGINCPLGGEYVLIPAESVASEYPVVACSLHYVPELLSEPEPKPKPKPLTSLGSSFKEITHGMIDLIEKYYRENGKYPRSWGDYRFTDIGLDPNEWTQGHNGIIYSPVGNRVAIKPDEGYTFYVTDLKGKERELSWTYKWNIVYSVETNQWYYHTIAKGKAIDISTLEVKEQKK